MYLVNDLLDDHDLPVRAAPDGMHAPNDHAWSRPLRTAVLLDESTCGALRAICRAQYIHGQKLACLTERQLHHHFEVLTRPPSAPVSCRARRARSRPLLPVLPPLQQLRDGPQQLYPHALESDFLQRGGKLKARQLREQDKKLPEKEFPTPLEVLGDLIEPFPTAAMPEDSGDTAGVAAKKPEQTNPVKKMQALIPPRR